MPVKTDLIASLQRKAQISAKEEIYSLVGDFLDDAIVEHAPDLNKDFELLKSTEYELVLTLAWERACLARASLVAPQSSARNGSSGFGADRDTPFEKNTRLAKLLRERYDILKSAQATNATPETDAEAAGDIVVGELFRQDEVIQTRVPLSTAPTLAVPTLKVGVKTVAAGVGAGSVILYWTEFSSPMFLELYVLKSSSAGIYQNWNHDGANGIPNASSDSSRIFLTSDSKKEAVKVINLAAGTYYFVLVVRDASGRFRFSNEVSVDIADS